MPVESVLPEGEGLELGSVDFRKPAHWIADFSPLLTIEKVGNDRPLPGLTTGNRPYRRKTTGVSISLIVTIDGNWTEAGERSATPRASMWEHLAFIETNLLDDIESIAGTIDGTWYRPDGDRDGLVIVEGFVAAPGADDYETEGTLDLTIPAGIWVPNGS